MIYNTGGFLWQEQPERESWSSMLWYYGNLHGNPLSLSSGVNFYFLVVDHNPRNFPKVTPNLHFSGFIFSLCWKSLSKTTIRCFEWSILWCILTTKASTWHSIVFLSISLKMIVMTLWYVDLVFLKSNGMLGCSQRIMRPFVLTRLCDWNAVFSALPGHI